MLLNQILLSRAGQNLSAKHLSLATKGVLQCPSPPFLLFPIVYYFIFNFSLKREGKIQNSKQPFSFVVKYRDDQLFT